MLRLECTIYVVVGKNGGVIRCAYKDEKEAEDHAKEIGGTVVPVLLVGDKV